MSRTFGSHGNTGFITSPTEMVSPRRQVVDDTKSNYSYAAKSKMIYSRKGLGSATSKRSKTNNRLSVKAGNMREQLGPYVEEREQKQETKSQLNYIAMKRFNETPTDDRPKSQAGRSIFSKPKSQVGSKIGSNAGRSVFSQQQKKMDIYKAVDRLDDLQIDQISAIISNNRREPEQLDEAPLDQDDAAGEEADQVKDLDEDRLTSITGVKPTASMVSGMSGRTYISTLQNQLLEEKEARLKLEAELEELKKISSEITS